MNLIINNKYILILLVFFFTPIISLYAQQSTLIEGQILSKKNKSPLVGVVVSMVNLNDSLTKKNSLTDSEGKFKINNISYGNYRLTASYIGFEKFSAIVKINSTIENIGVFKMIENLNQLKDVTITESVIRSQQKNDTVEYNAKAFKTNPDANVQDLITKMPGITVENGTVKAQGENVQRVTVDGKEFFGDDVTLALKNLPAEVIEKIQVFDKQSDQSQFTGFNDGNTQKSINIVTKAGKNLGKFGRLYAGAGTDERYTAGGNMNFFRGKQRISLLGLSNNINQQNFGSQDLLGLQSGSNQAGRGGRGFGGGGMPGGGGGGSASNNFIVGNQNGINKTNSAGINFSDVWAKKLTVTGSYFFNQSTNNTINQLQRTSFLSGDVNQLYNQNSESRSDNNNHRLNVRLEYNIDSNNTIILTPKLSFQDNSAVSTINGLSTFNGESLNKTNTINSSNNSGVSLNNNILYRHKFLKQGRTISFNVGTDVNNKNGSSNLGSNNIFYFPTDTVSKFEQRTTTIGNNYTLSGALFYTEQIGKNGMIMANYSPSFTQNYNDKLTNTKDTLNGEYNIINNNLSSNYENTLTTQRGGLNYRYNIGEKVSFMLGANYQNVLLEGVQKTPKYDVVKKTFDNILPNAMLRYQFSKQSNIRIFYRTNTNAPSISQLQTVIDNSNPLSLNTGNSQLQQEFSHSIVTRYGLTNSDKGKTFNLFLNANNTQNYIGNSTYTARNNSDTVDGITLSKGSQLSKPENFDGYWNINSFITYGFPVKKLKSNLNLNLGATYNKTPSKINNMVNYTNTYMLNSGFALASNISEKIDFTISYTAFYNIVENTLNAKLNNNYFNQISSAKLNLLPYKGLVLRSEIINTYYTGLGNSFDQNFFLWTGGIGYKFLKNNAAEIVFNTYDILNQNNNINRTVSGNYIEDSKTQVLNRYYMLVFTYNIRSFGGRK
ncbi:MAG: outer membrane beta-barrel protein [Bacteroidia bacterium]